MHNDVIVQIDDFLVLVDKQREIKSNEVQLLKQENVSREEVEGSVGTAVSALTMATAPHHIRRA